MLQQIIRRDIPSFSRRLRLFFFRLRLFVILEMIYESLTVISGRPKSTNQKFTQELKLYQVDWSACCCCCRFTSLFVKKKTFSRFLYLSIYLVLCE